MTSTEELGLELTGGYAHGPYGLIVTSEAEQEAAKNVDHTYVYMYADDEQEWFHVVDWQRAVTSSTFLKLGKKVFRFFLTADGIVYRRDRGDITSETIDASDNGPNDLVLMRCLLAVGDDLIAVGMARHAYRRTRDGTWHAIDASCFVPREARDESVGFNGVAGARLDQLVAAGYKGEIWSYDGQAWSQEASPTNITLTAIAHDPDGGYLIGGMRGMLISGRPGQWHVIEQDATDADFWGVAYFEGKYYASNYDGVFVLEAGGLRKCYPQGDTINKTAYVSAGADKLWSVGQQHVAWSADGAAWQEIESP